MIIYQTYLKDPKNDITLKLFDNDKKIDITSINENPFKRLLFHKNLKYYCVPFGIANQLYPNVDSLENNQKSLLVIYYNSYIIIKSLIIVITIIYIIMKFFS